MARSYFGTDGVRGIVGETLTPDLVERLGRAATTWAGRGRVFVGRDTRGSGPMLEEAFARGIVSAGGRRCSAASSRRRPSRCSRRISAPSSRPPTTHPSTTASSCSTRKATSSWTRDEEEIEALLDAPGVARRLGRAAARRRRGLRRAHPRALRLATSTAFGSRSTAPTARTRRSRRACSRSSAPR